MVIKKFLFDLGNVFFDWSPKHVFKNYIPNENKLDKFLKNIAFPHLDMRCDAGIKIDVAVKEAVEKFNLVKPETVGQANRISGIKPSDSTVLIINILK